MPNPRLAERYAKSLIDLSTEFNQLDVIYSDMQLLQSVCDKSKDFVSMLNSPVINTDKKYKIIDAITAGKISSLSQSFIRLLCKKSRESNLPEIITAFISQFNKIKGIHKVTLVTAVPVSDEIKNSFIQKIKASSGITNINLEASVDQKLVGGFILEMDGKLIDATVLRDLNDVKKQFANNDYIHKLR